MESSFFRVSPVSVGRVADVRPRKTEVDSCGVCGLARAESAVVTVTDTRRSTKTSIPVTCIPQTCRP